MTNEASTSVISADEVLRLIKLFEEAIVKGRSKDEIFKLFGMPASFLKTEI